MAGTRAGAEAPPSGDRLKQLENALAQGRAQQEELKKKAEALARELDDIKAEMVQAARATQDREEVLSDLENQVTELKAAETEDLNNLNRRRQQMVGLLTALQRLAWRPSEALIAQPTAPADTVRSILLMRAALPKIEDEARTLRQELDQIASLRADIDRQKTRIGSATVELAGDHKRLQALFQRKSQLQQKTEAQGLEQERRLARMASEAEDLRDLLARLEADRQRRQQEEDKSRQAEDAARKQVEAAAEKAGKLSRKEKEPKPQQAALPLPHGKPFSQAQGRMPFPAVGRLAKRFGAPTAAGTTTKGLTIETREGAQVIAPYDGQVVFSGPFRGYGQVLIIEHSEGYHTLLAGMARIDSAVGQRLLAGEPVGVMEESEGKPALYVELRRNGQPVNPLPWLTARKDKVSG
ncbi:MAG: peptidoglycan DD-metalloendopeptidase family protein [Rhodospirillales bacterium]|nr:peptidoglycan DD-metalloendopeptidase family protein [Rhodospirillales bacterium]